LPWVQESILSTKTVPWLTIAIQDGSYSGQVSGQGNLSEPLSLFASIVLKG
jgi:hypothetical protein